MESGMHLVFLQSQDFIIILMGRVGKIHYNGPSCEDCHVGMNVHVLILHCSVSQV